MYVLVPVPDDTNRYDVYQIKYFFKSLDRSQRSQIANSAATLLSAVRDEKIRVRNWHLVLPLDPTENDEEWLRSEFEGTGIRAFWKGLSHLEALLTFPWVIFMIVRGVGGRGRRG